MQEMIKERIRSLIESGAADRVIGWEEGEFFYDRTPKVFGADSLDALKYDEFCGANLAKYLISETKKDGKIIALIKPCDSYSLNQLCTEHRVDRDKVYAIGVGCKGKIDVEKLRKMGIKGITAIVEDGDELKVTTLYGEKTVKRADALLTKCLACKGKEHKGVDETLGESADTTSGDKFDIVSKIEAMSADERFEYFRSEFSKCIRCNACRNVCPACSCVKCVFDNNNSGISAKANDTEFEEKLYHIIRAFHVSGRCTDCGECSRVCPQNIPLHLLNRKFIKDINVLYGEYVAGEESEGRTPLTSFTTEDVEPNDAITEARK